MDSQEISEWLASISALEKARAMAKIYHELTIWTRLLFLPGAADGREQAIIHALHGINELHHTIANQALAYSFGDSGWPPDLLARQLVEIADQYGLKGPLSHAIDVARTRNP